MILGLREFTRLRWDPRALIIDAREHRSARGNPLDNHFFAWIRIVNASEAERMASDLSQRHLIIVHEDEERALDLDHVFESLEIHSWALEGGETGWNQAILEERSETCGDKLFITMNQLALDRRLYMVVHENRAVVVQPAGSIAAIRQFARHHGAVIEAVVEISKPENDTGARLARAAHARYYLPETFKSALLDGCFRQLHDLISISGHTCALRLV